MGFGVVIGFLDFWKDFMVVLVEDFVFVYLGKDVDDVVILGGGFVGLFCVLKFSLCLVIVIFNVLIG